MEDPGLTLLRTWVEVFSGTDPYANPRNRAIRLHELAAETRKYLAPLEPPPAPEPSDTERSPKHPKARRRGSSKHPRR